ncbi:MAG: hypothetical protein LBC07_00095 [Elusimicrobiota bacterium]|jgi:hypothetical protein|nr:hypothetical protein [Elusimicrobiota bacterium]
MAGENLIYDYALKVNIINSVASADTTFLRKALVVVAPKVTWVDTDKVIKATKTTIGNITDNQNVVEIFNGGVSEILVIATDNLAGIKDVYEDDLNNFYTILVAREFTDAQIAALDVGNFKGVLFSSSTDIPWASTQAKKRLKGVYYKLEANFFYAWGKFLSATEWSNMQYQILLGDDGIVDNADAEILFESRVSFSLKDSQSANRLSFFVQGGEAIIAPYVLKEIELRMQSETVNWIALNRPQYTLVDCAILGQYLQNKVINDYVTRGLVSGGSVEITTQGGQNFMARGTIAIPTPTALWRVMADFYITNN